jgi:hypothetical protein
MKIWAAILSIILTSLHLEAKVFRNAYVAFELPDSWNCALEHTEWICRSQISIEAKEAIIILTAKEVGPEDSLEAYAQHLNTPQGPHSATSGANPGRIVAPGKQVTISDHIWIDGLQQGSEVPNYFTRYLATIKDRIAILVTLSAHKDHYTKYSPDFFKAVQSLRVIASPGLANNETTGALRPGSETLGAPISAAMSAEMGLAPEDGGAKGSGGTTKTVFLGVALALAGLAIFLVLKTRKK